MGTFFNNFKRKFTAPKTRDMQKKIHSMKDYLGFAKAEFQKMEADAQFYKHKEEALSKACRALNSGGVLFNTSDNYDQFKKNDTYYEYNKYRNYEYEFKIPYKYTDEKGNYKSPSLFLYEITSYKPTALIDDEEFIKEAKTLTSEILTESNDFDAFNGQHKQNFTDNEKNYSTDKCLELLKKCQRFCRKYKQKIKNIFEQKKKQFSKEKTKLTELSALIQELKKAKSLTDKVEKWENINTWYKNIKDNLTDKNDNPVAQVYQKSIEYIKKAFEDHINALSEEIRVKLNQYYEPEGQTIGKLRTEFEEMLEKYEQICEYFDDENKKAALDYINKIKPVICLSPSKAKIIVSREHRR